MKYLAHPAILVKDLASSIQHLKKEFPSSYKQRIKQENDNKASKSLKSI
jgi:hypothetical protein